MDVARCKKDDTLDLVGEAGALVTLLPLKLSVFGADAGCASLDCCEATALSLYEGSALATFVGSCKKKHL